MDRRSHRGDRVNSREHLSQDLETIIKRTKQIGAVAWLVAIFVMVYGTPIVYELATDHGIPAGVAWMLSLAADGALVVGLIATPVLAQLGIPAGWVGTLRWVSGGTTWTLQTLSSWIAPDGPDMVGVGVHSAGPLLLFVVVEAASYFQRKVASAIVEKTRALEAAEQKDADRRAHLAEMEAGLRTARAEVSALTSKQNNLLREIEKLKAERASTVADRDSEIADLRASVKAAEAEKEEIREAGERKLEAASKEYAEGLRKNKQQYNEKLSASSTINLAERRRRNSGEPVKAAPKPRVSDEDAVQRLLDTAGGLTRDWSQKAIVDELGVGWGRAPRLLEAVSEEQERRRSGGLSGDQAVNE
jgi:hypothetical protein